MAVAVDQQFFAAIGGPSLNPTQDLSGGDIIWMIPELVMDEAGKYRLQRGHWEVLTLEDSAAKLLATQTVSRDTFESPLIERLANLAPPI